VAPESAERLLPEADAAFVVVHRRQLGQPVELLQLLPVAFPALFDQILDAVLDAAHRSHRPFVTGAPRRVWFLGLTGPSPSDRSSCTRGPPGGSPARTSPR